MTIPSDRVGDLIFLSGDGYSSREEWEVIDVIVPDHRPHTTLHLPIACREGHGIVTISGSGEVGISPPNRAFSLSGVCFPADPIRRS